MYSKIDERRWTCDAQGIKILWNLPCARSYKQMSRQNRSWEMLRQCRTAANSTITLRWHILCSIKWVSSTRVSVLSYDFGPLAIRELVFTLTRQRCSRTTFCSYLALLVWGSNILNIPQSSILTVAKVTKKWEKFSAFPFLIMITEFVPTFSPDMKSA